MTTLKELIDSKNFDYVNSYIESNLKLEEVRSTDYKLYSFERYISSEEVIKEMEKEGYLPATLTELLEWKGLRGFITALGSVAEVDGVRHVPCLDEGGSRRRLGLDSFDRGWGARCRFLAVRNMSSKSGNISTPALGDLETLTLESAIKLVKEAGYVISKII